MCIIAQYMTEPKINIYIDWGDRVASGATSMNPIISGRRLDRRRRGVGCDSALLYWHFPRGQRVRYRFRKEDVKWTIAAD